MDASSNTAALEQSGRLSNGKKQRRGVARRPWRRLLRNPQQRTLNDDSERTNDIATPTVHNHNRSMDGEGGDNNHGSNPLCGRFSVVSRGGSLDRMIEVNHNDTGNRPSNHERKKIGFFSRAIGAVSSRNATPSEGIQQSDDVVNAFASTLRLVLAITVSYLVGSYDRSPLHVIYARKVLEYTAVAWFTCICIQLTVMLRHATTGKPLKTSGSAVRISQYQQHQFLSSDDDKRLEGESPDLEAPMATREMARLGKLANSLPPEVDDLVEEMNENEMSSIGDDSIDDEPISTSANAHPALESLFVIDTSKGERAFPNWIHGYEVDTEYCCGRMMVLIRTPDVDDPTTAIPGTVHNASAAMYFSKKQRRWEFQFQVRLKKVPQGRVYFSCELHELKMGMIQRAFVGAAMAFVKSSNSNFHYTMTGSAYSPDGKYEKPHMAFPVEEGMNRLVATPPGQTPPKLGEEIHEDEESIKARKKGQRMNWNTNDTYTLALWTAYVDFLNWRVMNLPGLRDFSLVNVIGRQPIFLTVYEIPESRANEKQYCCDITNIARLELSNADQSGLGEAARAWVDDRQRSSNIVPMKPQLEAQALIQREAGDNDEGFPDEGPRPDEEPRPEEEPLIEDNSSDEEAAAELGYGIYVRSGDNITLKEFIADEGAESTFYITNGGGFAVLQELGPSTIVIEKAGKSRARKHHLTPNARLIRSGDTVVLKLVTKVHNGEDSVTRHLSTHRGWWLKWSSSVPTVNGLFTIHTCEKDVGNEHDAQSSETRSSYLTFGGSFYLRHKRWSKYFVGIASQGSATYGGRILGLHVPEDRTPLQLDFDNHSDDGKVLEHIDDEGKQWMRPLLLQAYEGVGGSSLQMKVPCDDQQDEINDDLGKKRLVFSLDDYHVDVPAWLEVMNRTKRVRQLVYLVRVLPPVETEEKARMESLYRLRTGRDLSQIMRIGLNWRNDSASPSKNGVSAAEASPQRSPTDARGRSLSTPTGHTITKMHSFDSIDREANAEGDSESDGELEVRSCDDLDHGIDSFDENELPTEETEVPRSPGSRRSKGRKLFGKIARSTTSTGKKVVKQGVKVGIGTVQLISVRPRKPPSKEPSQTGKMRSRKRVERDLHVLVSSRSMRRMELNESRRQRVNTPTILAGELSAPEQSCRTVSNMLLKMSTVPLSSPYCSRFSTLLASQIETNSELDRSFLQGGSLQLGVDPGKPDVKKGKLLADSLVARCLWESHWREEWCGLYENSLAFFAPLSRSPCLEVALADIRDVRFLDSQGPIGFPVLVIVTSWVNRYLAFGSLSARETFRSRLDESLKNRSSMLTSGLLENQDSELTKARFWQGFQDSMASSTSAGRGKWADIPSGQQTKSRVVLNNKRMAFDVVNRSESIDEFVENMLSTCLSFSIQSVEKDPTSWTSFLDATSELRNLSLADIDLSAKSTFCLFVNLYHCLLQHAMILTVHGPLQKRNYGHFMRTSCYEIGGDVFSLAEIYCYVIRGKMSRPVNPKPPYLDISKKPSPYLVYALKYTDVSVNFLLNTGDISCPKEVPVLKWIGLDEIIAAQAAEFLKRNITISKRVITQPKICDIYRNDFPADSSVPGVSSLRFCLRYMDKIIASQIHSLLKDEVTIKYQPTAEQYHSLLRVLNFPDSITSDPSTTVT